jgi:AcrR family transcriptional regulator
MDHSVDGSRKARREELRQVVSQRAIGLFLARGFERTTIDEIVKPLGVSRRTFFRHFETKEDLLFVWYESLGQKIVEVCAARPLDEAPFVSACVALRSLLKYYDEDPTWAAAMMKLTAETPSLIAKSLQKRAMWEVELAKVLAPRIGGKNAGLHARVIAGTAVNTFALAVESWFAGSSSHDLHSTVDSAFAFASDLGTVHSRR